MLIYCVGASNPGDVLSIQEDMEDDKETSQLHCDDYEETGSIKLLFQNCWQLPKVLNIQKKKDIETAAQKCLMHFNCILDWSSFCL